jgi:hypothetical protein
MRVTISRYLTLAWEILCRENSNEAVGGMKATYFIPEEEFQPCSGHGESKVT